MNMKSIWLTAVLVSALIHRTEATAQVLGQWHFDENSGTTASDSAGSNDGALNGDAFFAPVGIAGNAVGMSRVGGGYISMGDVFPMTTGSFSLVTWVMTAQGYQADDLSCLARHEAGTANGYIIGVNANGPYGRTNKAWFYVSVPSGSELISTTDVTDGDWHQVVAVYHSSGFAELFVDGGQAEDSGNMPAVVANDAPFRVGGVSRSGMPEATFDGYVDELQVYGRALSAFEVQALFERPAAALLFASGVERGDTSAWSLQQPPP